MNKLTPEELVKIAIKAKLRLDHVILVEGDRASYLNYRQTDTGRYNCPYCSAPTDFKWECEACTARAEYATDNYSDPHEAAL